MTCTLRRLDPSIIRRRPVESSSSLYTYYFTSPLPLPCYDVTRGRRANRVTGDRPRVSASRANSDPPPRRDDASERRRFRDGSAIPPDPRRHMNHYFFVYDRKRSAAALVPTARARAVFDLVRLLVRQLHGPSVEKTSVVYVA